MSASTLLGSLLTYVVLGRLFMRSFNGLVREFLFATLNLGAVYYFLFTVGQKPIATYEWHHFCSYVVLVIGLYLMLLLFARKGGGWHWLAFFAPILALVFLRYVPAPVYVAVGHLFHASWLGAPAFIGLSYLAFRCSRLALDIRNGVVKTPNFLEYLNFAFFLPTMSVGPINNYANFRRGFDAKPYDVAFGRAVFRILVGAAKCDFLGSFCNRLTYSGLIYDDHLHRWVDLPIAMLFYYLYLYLNFSGFCDIAIGASALIGIPVPENFENPLAARNMRDFWNRWHITLSTWMRDMVFSPLSKNLVGQLGIKYADHAVAIAVLVAFLLIGIWHGVGWNYVLYGLAQAAGVITVHYYTIFLKRRLGRDGLRAYNENRLIRGTAVLITFCYCASTLFLFANSFDNMKIIFSVLR